VKCGSACSLPSAAATQGSIVFIISSTPAGRVDISFHLSLDITEQWSPYNIKYIDGARACARVVL